MAPAGDHRGAWRRILTSREMFCICVLLAFGGLFVSIRFLPPPPAPSGAETRSIEGTLLRAVEAYNESTGAYPQEVTDPNLLWPKGVPNPPGPGAYRPADWNARVRIRSLWDQMAGDAASSKMLLILPARFVNVKERLLLDSLGRPLDYRRSAGAGGGPVILSAGADGDFDTEDDNVRSDGLGK